MAVVLGTTLFDDEQLDVNDQVSKEPNNKDDGQMVGSREYKGGTYNLTYLSIDGLTSTAFASHTMSEGDSISDTRMTTGAMLSTNTRRYGT